MKMTPPGLTLVTVLLMFSPLSLVPSAQATLRTWVGSSDNSWTNSANWSATIAPVPGDDLVFPASASTFFPSNNFPAGTTFNSITISGGSYTFSGSRIGLNAGLNATNTTLQNYFMIPLTLNSNQTITTGNATVNLYLYGDIDLNGNQLRFAGSGFAQTQSAISRTGSLIKTGSGGLLLYASNSFSGSLQIQQGTLSAYATNALGDTNSSVTVSNGATLVLVGVPLAKPLVLAGALNTATAPTVLTGPITLESNAGILTASGAPLTINSVIAGSGGFAKSGNDLLTLNSNNTYTGSTILNAGTLQVNGLQPQSAVTVNTGLLGGTGTVGTITCANNGTVKYLKPGASPGILTCSNVVLDLLATLDIEINGTSPGSGYDQLSVHGSVTLNNHPSLLLTLGFTPSVGDSFVIISNDGTDAVNGTLAGLPEGGFVTNGTVVLQITYAGGDGNDVVLTRVALPTPTVSLSIEHVPNNSVRLLWPTNPPGFNLESKTNLTTTNWSGVSPVPAVVGTNYVVTNLADQPQQFYRLYKP